MRSFFVKIRETIKVFFLFLKELKWLFHIFDINKSDRPLIYPEIVEFKPITLKNFNINLLIKGALKTTHEDIVKKESCVHPSQGEVYWYHINGMIADPTELTINAKYLELLFGCTINHIYNPTDGFIQDLYQVYSGRVLNRFEEESRHAKCVIAEKLKQGKKCVLIAHSQGGIIISNVMKLLAADPEVVEFCKNLEVYTFGSAMDEFKKPHKDTHAEHFINEHDFVARVGVLAYKDKVEGKIYIRKNAKGHLLNRNYLGGFSKGLYCFKHSRLYERYRDNKNTNI